MLTERTISQVRDVSIVAVVSRFVNLRMRGSNAIGLCPFHEEHTPSFSVSERKGLYKCFGCGVGGDGIHFIMHHEKLDFIAAVEFIAGIAGIAIEEEDVPDRESYLHALETKSLLKKFLSYTADRYREQLWCLPPDDPVQLYLTERKISPGIIAEWQLGWSGVEWQGITQDIILKGGYDAGIQLGIIRRGKVDDRNYDGYRSRIIIPIHNHHGELIGLGGRFLAIDPTDLGKQYPKYINSPENPLYNKGNILYGLDKAIRAVQASGFAFLVEGYFDVILMHTNGDGNTVGTCGTALTMQQAKLLKRFTSHVVVMRDADAAGRRAAEKDISLLLSAGFKVDIILLPVPHDPDSYVRQLITNHYLAGTVDFFDGVIWLSDNLVKSADDHFQLGAAQEAVLKLISGIPNDIIRANYFDSLVKRYKWPKPLMYKQLNGLLENHSADADDDGSTNLDKLPKWMDREQFLSQGYCAVNNKSRTGYYTFGASGQVEITNFLIKPLFHIYAGKESRHMIQIDNGRKKAVIDIESKALVSIELLQQYVVCEGPYIIYGSKAQMLRIATQLLGEFPRCIEIKFLGWQSPGFFAFVDRVYYPSTGLVEISEWGIIVHEQKNFLIPAASAAYMEIQATGEDPYENDRVLSYTATEVSFQEWAKLFSRVYLEKGAVGIAFSILTAFRDIVFDVDNNCPHLYGFGERSSGKSKWAESITALFYRKRQAFNLNSGTDFAFFSYMQRFINCPSALNEFDEAIIKPEWFQAIKGIFDGEGRQRGMLGSRNRTEIMKIRSTLILTGQFLCTMDDNSIVSRSIIEGFSERIISDDDKGAYDQLKSLEEQGLSGVLIEILQYRKAFEQQYRTRFNENLSNWRRSDPQLYNQRIIQNWCHLYTCWQIMSEFMQLPVTNDQFEEYCKSKSIHWSTFIRSSDTLSEFWSTVAFLVDQGAIVEGWDYKIDTVREIRLRKDRKEEYSQTFPEPVKIIYLRLNNIHKHYQQAYRMRTGREGMSMENLLHYFGSRKYFLGNHKQSRFKRFITKTENVSRQTAGGPISVPETTRTEEQIITSSFVFLYDQLELDLERIGREDAPAAIPDAKPTLPF